MSHEVNGIKTEAGFAGPMGIYLSLDVLLDTRIATIARVAGDEVALSVLAANYHGRLEDRFPGVDMVAYKKAYQERDTETLRLSTVTDVITLLREIVGALTLQATTRPYHSGTRIVVNTYPYSLSPVELEAFKESIMSWMDVYSGLGTSLTTETVFLSEKELTPAYCSENFSAMLMYEYESWFGAQSEELRKCPIQGITLYAPGLYTVKVPTRQEMKELIKESAPPLQATELMASPFIKLEHLTVETFSIIKPPPPENDKPT
jgi:hypothetical protein